MTTTFQFVNVHTGVVYTNYESGLHKRRNVRLDGRDEDSAACTYPNAGSYDVTLRVTDNTNTKSTLRKNGYVNVSHRSPSSPTSLA